MELAAAVADPETKRYVLEAKAVEAAYSLLKKPALDTPSTRAMVATGK